MELVVRPTLIGTSRISRTTVARSGPSVTVLIASSLRLISAVWTESDAIFLIFSGSSIAMKVGF